ncbi:undecaprenyl-phosphate alpha-N-acetylglucosaminyl 1-phosphate transferase [Tepiditoga spiralis]|uniref:Undecaprenyl-phosphate alpha-N-acetylglucosaminyl 1-phosphate transferase n=1 Tax=Tepiditoga spiralis TaxID=2108365 RepID=A0A7G1GAL6_9BACT|nr:MraY family glycosyltransferase [Tepiditoga spiralis]BBE30549.1 undecaprenyl-phosphate alpha-N-acetylglucosaminyl 1-phosphate transferase [Tepiditoga spiralis]
MYALSMIFAIILTPLMILIAKKANIVDNPDENLKTHKKSIPYLGGVAVLFSIIPFFIFNISYILPAVLITFLGLWDDIKNVNSKVRLILEFILMGITIYMIYGYIHIVYFFLLMITGVAIINSVNMIDGMDGVCSGITAIALTFFAILGDNSLYYIVFALIGFLIYNKYPAKIFLGDAGSYLLGFTLFYSITSLTQKHGNGGYFISLIIGGVFATDFSFAILRRILNKKSPFSGDREHIYDKLNRRFNSSVPLTVFVLYLISITYGLISLFSWNFPIYGAIISIVTFLILGKILNLYGYDK